MGTPGMPKLCLDVQKPACTQLHADRLHMAADTLNGVGTSPFLPCLSLPRTSPCLLHTPATICNGGRHAGSLPGQLQSLSTSDDADATLMQVLLMLIQQRPS